MSYLEELLPEFRNGAKIRRKDWGVSRMNFYEARVDVLENEKEELQQKLDIAMDALEKYKIEDETNNISEDVRFAEIALAKIAEIK